MIVLLEKGVWLTDGEGDPARTLLEEYATDFETFEKANKALSEARKYRPFPNAEIQDDFV